MNRNYVYAFPSAHGTCNVVNYSGSSYINLFLSSFDLFGSGGEMKYHNGNPLAGEDFWFECGIEFLDMLHTDSMRRAFKCMGVELVFEYPFKDIEYGT